LLRAFEPTFKRFISLLLRFLLGSPPCGVAADLTFDRILVIRQHNQLGDMLCAVPLLRALRDRFPSASIVLMASPVNYDVMVHLRYVDRVINFDKREFLRNGVCGIGNLVRFIRTLRAENFDLAIVPSTVSMSFTSDLLARLSGARTRIGANSLDGRENIAACCFNLPVELDWRTTPTRHQTLRNFDVARPLGLRTPDLRLEMTLNPLELEEANLLRQKKVEHGKKIVVYHPGAGKVPNRWDPRRFASVVNTLATARGVCTFISWGPMDDEPVKEMLRHVAVPYKLIKGRPIRAVAVYLSVADLVITNDTGIMHVAAAVGAPVLALFGPTDPAQWAPIGAQHRFLRGERGDIQCLSVSEVTRTAEEMLAASG